VAEASGEVAAQIERQLGRAGPVCALYDFGLANSTWLFGSNAAGLAGCSKRLAPVAVK